LCSNVLEIPSSRLPLQGEIVEAIHREKFITAQKRSRPAIYPSEFSFPVTEYLCSAYAALFDKSPEFSVKPGDCLRNSIGELL
jgi:hypothetical protein